MYEERPNVEPLVTRVHQGLASYRGDWELICVDDGSRDGTGERLREMADQTDGYLRVIRLRRNFGQTAAMQAGFDAARGELIATLDGDLQNDPADIPRMVDELLARDLDLLQGWRQQRQDALLMRKIPSRIANRLIGSVTGVVLHDYGCSLKVYRAEVIKEVTLLGEMHRFIPIFAAWDGARVTELPVRHHPRRFGESKYGLGRILRVLLDLFTLFFIDRALDRPMQFFGKIGVAAFALSIAVFLWALALRCFAHTSLIQTPLPLLAATIGLSGILFLLLGVLAEIITRTYFEARGKAPYKIRSITSHADATPPAAGPPRW